jgi:transcription initiation factor TFIID TATA-box-binding protein
LHKRFIRATTTPIEVFKKVIKHTPPDWEVSILPKRPKYKIENVVASVEVDAKIDLNLLARKQRDAEYNPEQFPGLMLRVKNPKATILVFNSGRMVITGLRRESEAEKAVENVIAKIRKAGITVSGVPKITIQNIVASGDLHSRVDLDMAQMALERCLYEPEVFPGLIYRMKTPKAVFLIFSSGRIVCAGTNKETITRKAIYLLADHMRDLGLIE